MKTEQELRDKLAKLLARDSRQFLFPDGLSKATACKTLLWALGENEDNHWYITAKPGPPVYVRARGEELW